MNLQELKLEVLKELFEGYKMYGGGGVYKVDDFELDFSNFTPHEVVSELVNEGLVKDPRFFGRETHCAISVTGIYRVDPDYFEQHVSSIISTLGTTGNDWLGVREILSLEPVHDCRARDIVKVLSSTGMIEDPQYREDIYVKLSPKGRDYYERNKAIFIP